MKVKFSVNERIVVSLTDIETLGGGISGLYSFKGFGSNHLSSLLL